MKEPLGCSGLIVSFWEIANVNLQGPFKVSSFRKGNDLNI